MQKKLLAISFVMLVTARLLFAGKFHDAVVDGDERVVQQILKSQPAQVDLRDSNGMTPLHVAVREGKPSIVSLLLSKGAKINATVAKGGATALHIAALNGRQDIVDLLLSKGADTLITNSSGDAPLQVAVHEGHASVIGTFKAHGYDVDTLKKAQRKGTRPSGTLSDDENLLAAC